MGSVNIQPRPLNKLLGSKGKVLMKCAIKIILAMLTVFLTACSHHSVYVSAAVDPAYSPSKTDPIFLTLSNDPTIKERQLVMVLKEELCRNGFNVVASVDSSKWTLGLSYERETYQFGSTSSAIVIPGNIPRVLGSSKPNIVTDSRIYLYLFKSDSYKASHPVSVWEGIVSSNDSVFQAYRPVIFKNVLDVFGQNLESQVRLSKAYLRNPGVCPSP